ncbi:MAG: Hsp20/alpha crystallin family protein [Massilia sp.]
MAGNITRFDPFSDLARFDPFRGFDELFNDMRLSPRLRSMEAAPQVRMDVSENEQNYIVKAEIPGVKKDDIKVNIDGNQVSISAEMRKEEQQTNNTALRSERSWGQYYRSFTLPQSVDDASASAQYNDGVLELTLPKKGGGSAKTLEIH